MINALKMLHCVCSLIWMAESVRQTSLQDTNSNVYSVSEKPHSKKQIHISEERDQLLQGGTATISYAKSHNLRKQMSVIRSH